MIVKAKDLRPGDFLVHKGDTVANVYKTGDGRVRVQLTNDGGSSYFRPDRGVKIL